MSRHRFTIDVEVADSGPLKPAWTPDEWDERDLYHYLSNGTAELESVVDYTLLEPAEEEETP